MPGSPSLKTLPADPDRSSADVAESSGFSLHVDHHSRVPPESSGFE